MDFAQLIQSANNSDDAVGQAVASDADARKAEINAARLKVIQEKLSDFATTNGMEYLHLSSIRPDLHMIGGFVFAVRLHGGVDPSRRQSTDTREVLWQHKVLLIGSNRTEEITELLIGTLMSLEFEGIRKVFNEASKDLWLFDKESVTRVLFGNSD